MKRYNVYVHNFIDFCNDVYMVLAEDPVYARHEAIQRMAEETGHGLDKWEITEVKEV